jgi:tetratricopeptide (TPR) repeat protein
VASGENGSTYSQLAGAAAVQMADGRWNEARECLTQALRAIPGKPHTPEHRKARISVHDKLAECCRQLGDRATAEQHQQESDLLRLLNKSARARSLDKLQDYLAAEKLHREALEIACRRLGTRHRETATVLTNLGTNIRLQGKPQTAIRHLQQGLQIRQEVLGADHLHTAQSYLEFGRTLRLLDRLPEAEEHVEKALKIRARDLGPESLDAAECYDALAGIHRVRGNFDVANSLCRKALAIREKSLGPDHEFTAASKHNLALIMERDRGPRSMPRRPANQPPAESGPADVKSTPAVPAKSRGKSIAGPVLWTTFLTFLVFAAAGWAAFSGPEIVRSLLFWTFVTVAVLGLAVMTVVQISTDRDWDSQLRWLLNTARKSFQNSSERLIDDETMLGGKSDPHGRSIGDPAKIVQLEAADARVLSRQNPLILNHVRQLSEAASRELARQTGRLELNGLVNLPSKLARPLRKHIGQLFLNGVQELSLPAAAHIARHAGDLHLDGLLELPPEAAEHFAHHRDGLLSLKGLRTISPEASSWLIKHRHFVYLTGLKPRLVPERSVEILRTNRKILLGEEFLQQ